MQDVFSELVAKFNVKSMVFASLPESQISRYGDLIGSECDGLLNTLFGNIENVDRLNASLEGQLLPRIWSQGSFDCIVSRPGVGIIIGVFLERVEDAVQSFKISREINGFIESFYLSGND